MAQRRNWESDVHRRKRIKNYTIFLLLIGLMVLIYFVAIHQMSRGAGGAG